MRTFFYRAKNFAAVVSLILLVCVFLGSCEKLPVGYDAGYLERKLALPYTIEAALSQNDEKYDVKINCGEYFRNLNTPIEQSDFSVEFLSGDVTEGLKVEFFENGVFLFFDDLRFKTNSELFTNLEYLKKGFNALAQSYVEKVIENTDPVNGIDIIEISAEIPTGGTVTAYLNKKDGSLIRMKTDADGKEIIVDVKNFENIIEPIEKETKPDSDYDADYSSEGEDITNMNPIEPQEQEPEENFNA